MDMALEEPDDALVSLDYEGIPFQHEEHLKPYVKNAMIDYIKTFWGEGLTIRSYAGGC